MDDSIVWLEEKRVERSKEWKDSSEQFCITNQARKSARIAACIGCIHYDTFAVQEDGYIYTDRWISEYPEMNKYPNLKKWCGFVGLSVSEEAVIGLKFDGSVVTLFAKNRIDKPNPCPRSEWHDVIQVLAIESKLYGLRSDGTVVCNCENVCKEWTNVVSISCHDKGCVGVTRDGDILSENANYHHYKNAILVAEDYVLLSDGTVIRDSTQETVYSSAIAVCTLGWRHDAVFLNQDGTLSSTSGEIAKRLDSQKDSVAISTGVEYKCGLYVVKENGQLLEIKCSSEGETKVFDDVRLPIERLTGICNTDRVDAGEIDDSTECKYKE